MFQVNPTAALIVNWIMLLINLKTNNIDNFVLNVKNKVKKYQTY